jgi:hypothetical protein
MMGAPSFPLIFRTTCSTSSISFPHPLAVVDFAALVGPFGFGGISAGSAVLPAAFGFGSRFVGPVAWTVGRVAQAFDLAGITNTGGAPSFAFLAKGGYPRTHTQWGLCRTDKSRVGSIATRPCKKREDGAPSA